MVSFSLMVEDEAERGAKEELSGVKGMSPFYLYLLRLSPKVSP